MGSNCSICSMELCTEPKECTFPDCVCVSSAYDPYDKTFSVVAYGGAHCKSYPVLIMCNLFISFTHYVIAIYVTGYFIAFALCNSYSDNDSDTAHKKNRCKCRI